MTATDDDPIASWRGCIGSRSL